MRKQCSKQEFAWYGEEDILLQKGVNVHNIASLPDWLEEGPIGQCYMNATSSVLEHEHLRYVEGYALFQGIPLQHAWVYDMATGLHHDVTSNHGWTEYQGIVFDTDFLIAFMLETRCYGIWGADHPHIVGPYMRDGFPDWAILEFNNGKRENHTRREERSEDGATPSELGG